MISVFTPDYDSIGPYFPLNGYVSSIGSNILYMFSPTSAKLVYEYKFEQEIKWICTLNNFTFVISMNDHTVLFDYMQNISNYVKEIETISVCIGLTKDLFAFVEKNDDEKVKIWDVSEKAQKYSLLGHNSTITYLLKLNNISFASGGKDTLIKIWNFHKGDLIKTLCCHSDFISHIGIIEDKNFLVSSDYKSEVIIWDIIRLKMISRKYVEYKNGRPINFYFMFIYKNYIGISLDTSQLCMMPVDSFI